MKGYAKCIVLLKYCQSTFKEDLPINTIINTVKEYLYHTTLSIIQQYLLSTYSNRPCGGPGNKARNKTDKSPCPHGAYVLVSEASQKFKKRKKKVSKRYSIEQRKKKKGRESREVLYGRGWNFRQEGHRQPHWPGEIWVKIWRKGKSHKAIWAKNIPRRGNSNYKGSKAGICLECLQCSKKQAEGQGGRSKESEEK